MVLFFLPYHFGAIGINDLFFAIKHILFKPNGFLIRQRMDIDSKLAHTTRYSFEDFPSSMGNSICTGNGKILGS
jgi:hypothetical protein